MRNTGNAALSIKKRIQADLRSAMQARSTLTIRARRALLAAIDNAQVVPVGYARVRYRVRQFGDGSAEVPRLPLGEDDIQKVVENELRLCYSAADELERRGKFQAASQTREEAAVIARYSNKT